MLKNEENNKDVKNNELTEDKLVEMFGEFPCTINVFLYKNRDTNGMGIGLQKFNKELQVGEDVPYGDTRVLFMENMVGVSLGVDRYESTSDLLAYFETIKEMWNL